MNSKMLDKIAQIEAISTTTLEFDQQRYDNYLNSQEGRTITNAQEETKKKIIEGKRLKYSSICI